MLSFGSYPAAPPAAPARPSSDRQPETKSERLWTVQVAALAHKKDADAMVLGLQNQGYNAFVMTTQSETRTWHRVRIGQFTDIGVAKKIRQTMVQMSPFKGAYVAVH
jgi:cell division septation protein DedD